MVHFLGSRRFNNQEEVEASVKEFFAPTTRTSICVRSKNWQNGGFRRYNTVAYGPLTEPSIRYYLHRTHLGKQAEVVTWLNGNVQVLRNDLYGCPHEIQWVWAWVWVLSQSQIAASRERAVTESTPLWQRSTAGLWLSTSQPRSRRSK